MLLYLNYIFVLLSFAAIPLARRDEIPITLMLAFSSLYYSIGGLWYWINAKNGIFAGLAWENSHLLLSATVITGSTAALSLCIITLSRTRARPLPPRRAQAAFDRGVPDPNRPLYNTFLWAGLAASAFVLAKGSFSGGADPSSRGPLFLIAYQFSDMLIAIIVYTIAWRGFTARTYALIGYFVFYATLVGFRYKIALMGIPIILFVLFSSTIKFRTKIAIVAISGTLTLALFSAMTLFRVKFGAPDLSKQISDPFASTMYSFFAETNILFGMSTIIQSNIRPHNLHLFQPIIDSVAELLPRFLFPGRTTGEYLRQMQMGFLTDQGMKSGTAYPWVGEFCIMFGWYGVAIGPAVMATAYELVARLVARTAPSARYYSMGIFLFTAVLGYYHFSRGYFPQIFKCYLFVLVPYILLCATMDRRAASTPRLST